MDIPVVTIRPARREEAGIVARLIMLAMNYDCCLHFVGEQLPGELHPSVEMRLAAFEEAMTVLVAREDSQYSYLNALVAEVKVGEVSLCQKDGSTRMAGKATGEVAGVCVAYDGGQLHALRRAFVEEMAARFGRDFSGMDDETSGGEFYADSLAVWPCWRGRGIATALLRATAERGREAGLPCVGLLVDQGNPLAERLYQRVGFRYVEDAVWGGHPMRRLRLALC